MKKIKILKTSYLKRKIKDLILKLCLLDFKFKKNSVSDNNKVLIVTMDSLGDNILKSKTIEILTDNFGKENTYIFCKNNWREIYKLQGYTNLFLDDSNWNIFYKISLYRKLNRINFSKIIVLGYGGTPPELEYLYNENQYKDLGKLDYVLTKLADILYQVFDKKFSIEEVKPDITKCFPEHRYSNIICVGIGASGNEKIMRSENMKKIILELLSKFPNKEIIILGAGKREKAYTEKLLHGIENKNLKNEVNKLSLLETMQYLNDCDLFIGMDSGLMNIAFSLNKKVICTHWCKEKHAWEHPFENVKILKGKGGKEYFDKIYGTETLNSITVEQIFEAIEELDIK